MTSADRLVQQIAKALEETPERVTLERLATEFTTQCRMANRRLEQCEDMLGAGSENEVIQLAEAPPGLLDLVATLSFDKCEEWRSFCKAKSLPTADTFNERAISRLNELYGKGIPPNHTLYKDYRAAMVERDVTRAMTTLRTILKLNPKDATARSESLRLEQKVRDDKLAQLHQWVQHRNVPQALELLGQLELLFRKPPLDGPVIEAAKALRAEQERLQAEQQCRERIDALLRAQRQDLWEEAYAQVCEVEHLCSSFKITLEPAAAADYRQARGWTLKFKEQQDAEARFQASLQDITQLVNQNLAKSSRPIPVLENFLQTLANKWAELELCGRPVPDELTAAVQRQYGQVRAAIKRRGRQRKILAAVVVLALLAAAGAGTVWFLSLQHEHALASRLGELKQKRQVAPAENYLAEIRQSEAATLKRGRFPSLLDETTTWIDEEKNRLRQWQEKAKQLARDAKQATAGAELETLTKDAQQLKQQAEGLAPEYLSLSELELDDIDKTLRRLQAQGQAKLVGETSQDLVLAEAEANTLDQSVGSLATLRKKLRTIGGIIQRVEPALATLKQTGGDNRTAERIEALKGRVAPLAAELNKLEDAEAELRKAKTIEDYWTALEHYDSDRLRLTPEVLLARKIQGAKSRLSDTAGTLLMPGDPEGWAYAKACTNSDLFPPDIQPPEAAKYLALRDDDNLRGVYRYQPPTGGWDDLKCSPAIHAKHFFTRKPIDITKLLGDQQGEDIWFTAQLYVPLEDSDKAVFVEQKYTCTRTRNGQTGTLENWGELSRESALFPQLGLKDIVDGNSEKFQATILGVLDTLRAATSLSPLFKAYVHYQLLELMDCRPLAWGLAWAPSVREDQRRLRKLGIGDMRSGDWMVPRQGRNLDEKLRGLYRETAGVSYLRQAKFFQKLVQDAVAAGIVYGGYVGTDGQPVIAADASLATEFWGLDKDELKLIPLYRSAGAQGTPQLLRAALPLTPLFIMKTDRKALLQTALQTQNMDADSPSIRPYLPPLFREK